MTDQNRRTDASHTAARPVADDRSSGPGRRVAGSVLTMGRNAIADAATRRPVDVVCAGMYRACSTWQYEVVAHLVEHHRDGRRRGYLTAEEYAGRIDRRESGSQQPESGWSVLKSHDADPCFAQAIASGRAVVIYAYRDVRDVVFSLMHKRRLTFEQILRQGMIHQILANDRFWTDQPNVLIQRYDDILTDPLSAVRALAEHLGICPDAGEAERIASEYSLEANKARTESLRRQLEQGGVDLGQDGNALICDPTTLLHWNHMRDGRSGSWLGASTPRQRFILGRLCGRWLASHDYPPMPDELRLDPAASPSPSLAERIGIEGDILSGWLSYRARMASQRFPKLSRLAKRLLGIADPSRAGATAWTESARKPSR